MRSSFITIVLLNISHYVVANITVIALWRNHKFYVLNHFWKNTGFSPLGSPLERNHYVLSYDERMNLAYVGSIPNRGIMHVRIHWLLDLVTISDNFSKPPVFNFQQLDQLIEWLHKHRLALHFEVMGNPSNYFNDFKTQGNDWCKLLKELVSRYIDFYGADYVRKWKFELLNEPDLRMYNIFNFTLSQYIYYFRATERALGNLIGPAGLFRNNRKSHPLCWGLLSYCNTNPCNLKTITFHRKGDGVASNVVRYGLDLIKELQAMYPNLTAISFGNDEADIMTGWYKPLEWRSDVRYAALVVQVIIGHIQEVLIKGKIPFDILSNDNAFLNYHPNYFNQRTLLARFQMNNTKPPHVQFFRKPVYSVMGFLSLLGSYLLDMKYSPGDNGFSYVYTAEKYRITFLGTMTNDSFGNSPYTQNVTTMDINIKLKLIEKESIQTFVVYVMDNVCNNPYQVWKDGGSPDYPGKDLRRRMRNSENPKLVYKKDVKPTNGKLSVLLPRSLNPTVFIINVCDFKYGPPGPTENLHYMKANDEEIILLWSDRLVRSRCLITYIIELRSPGNDPFERINDVNSIFLSYHFDGMINGSERSILGEYRVAAVDYCGRYGGYSNVLKITSL